MSAHERWEAAETRPQPAPLSGLSRRQVAARITVLRSVLDLLVDQMHADGGESFTTRGAAKVELLKLEAELRSRDAVQVTK